MTTVSLDRDLAVDLFKLKLRDIKTDIQVIIEKWEYKDPHKLITDTRTGKLAEAELDAISLTNLLEKKNKMETLLLSIREE